MSRLLHSKTFRNNLFKWLILYVCAILVVTSVVTYSKYMSSMMGQSTGRAAKFNVGLTKGSICSSTSDVCDLASFKPYDTLEYNFSINPAELEVKSNVVLVVNVDSNFDVLSFYDQVNNKTLDATTETNKTLDDGNLTYLPSARRFTLNINNVGANNNTVRNYKILLKLSSMTNDEKKAYYKTVHSYDDMVTISYTATQID